MPDHDHPDGEQSVFYTPDEIRKPPSLSALDNFGTPAVVDDLSAPKQGPFLGMNSFTVIPDAQAAQLPQLGPHTITQSQKAELEKYGFDNYHVLAHQQPGQQLANDQMTEDNFEQLAQAWLKIAANVNNRDAASGLRIAGNLDDVDAYKQMLAGSLTSSPMLRDLVSSIGNNPRALMQARLVHDEPPGSMKPGVMVDDFFTDEVDIDDLQKFPQSERRTPRGDHAGRASWSHSKRAAVRSR
jgi:hypothetical protein